MILRRWLPVMVAFGLSLAIYTALLWRIEDRILVRQAAVDAELTRLRQELATDTNVLALEVERQYNDCFAQTRKGE